MSSTTALCLSRTTAATFEELALLFPDPDPTPEQLGQPRDVTVSVDFRGPLTGRLVLSASSAILPLIAANMLGETEGRQPQLQRDALGEVANVVCGNLLPAIAGAEAVFHLAAPRVHAAGAAVPAPLSRDSDVPVATALVGLDDGCAEAALYLFGDQSALTTGMSVGLASV